MATPRRPALPIAGPSRRVALIGASLALLVGRAAALEIGQPAPAIKLPGLGDAQVELAALAGQVVYVDFWASWCAPCRLSFPFMNDLQARHQAQGLRVLAVNVDARRADADRFLAATPARFTVAFDPSGDTPRRWEVKTMPSSALVGRDGRLLWLHRGFRDEDRADIAARVAAALAK